ncbi:MAG: polysaccharide biosynthesis/export family protein [Gemmatimonadaceae bacterium]
MPSLNPRACLRVCLASLLAIAAAPPSAARAQGTPANAFRGEAPARPAPAAGSTKFTLRSGDSVRVRIWREPDLSGAFPVIEPGVVTLPKLGLLEVAGRDPDSLRAAILAGYAKYLVNSSMEVVFVHRVQVVGEVRKPNLYYADETMTVGDVLALAGGASDRGKLDEIGLVRDGQRLPLRLSQSTVLGQSPIRSGDQILVPQKSWIARNPAIFVAGITTVATLAVRILLDNNHR